MLEIYYVGSSGIHVCHEPMDEIRLDPRGLFLAWEKPDSAATYKLSADPSVGITNWSRSNRTSEDHKTDNGAICILKVDAIREQEKDAEGKPKFDPSSKLPIWKYIDVQVGEYAAPCDATELARVCNLLGRIYAGIDGDQCEMIYEAYPGPGILMTQELLRLGYGNIWMWERIADSVAEQTTRMGWYSTAESQKILWIRARRHLLRGNIKIRSRWLKEEYANAEIDLLKARAKAAYGYHDDRMQACNMAMWCAHKWTYDPERSEETVSSSPVHNPQTYAPTLDDSDTRTYRERWRDEVDSW